MASAAQKAAKAKFLAMVKGKGKAKGKAVVSPKGKGGGKKGSVRSAY